MGLFGITLKKIEALPGNIVGGAEDAWHDAFGGGNNNAPSTPPMMNRGASLPNAMSAGQPPVQGQPRPNLAFLTQPQPNQTPPGMKRDSHGNLVPINAGQGESSITPLNVVQQFTRALPEVGATLTNSTLYPSSGLGKVLFGPSPVKPVQQDVKGVYQAVKSGHQDLPGNLPIPSYLAAPYAAADVAVHAANDLPVVGGAIKAAKAFLAPTEAADAAVTAGQVAKVPVSLKQATQSTTEAPPKVAVKSSVVPAPPSPEGSVGAEVKDVSAPVKELANKTTILKQIGTPSSQELAQRITNIDNATQDLRAGYRNAVPTALSLNDAEFRNFGRAIEDGTQPINSRVRQAVAEHQALFPKIHGNYAATGVSVGKLPNYFPRDYSGMKAGTNSYNKALQGLVDSGKAKTTGDAVKLLDVLKKKGESSPAFFGSFDKSRLGTDYAIYTKSAYEKYLNGAARKTAEAQQLGPKGEISNQLIGQISQEGGDHILAQQVLKNYLHDAGAGKGKALSTVRGAFGVARLGKASISHLGQTSNVGLVTRLGDLGSAWAKRFGKEGQQFIKESDVNNPENLHGLVDQATTVHGVLSKGTAPLLQQMMQVNRGVSALAGRNYGNFLASKGAEAELRSLGVTGDIGKTLTRDQQLQAARGVTNKTMFTPSRAQTPLHAETPVGKTVGQYRLAYSYKQLGLVYNQVIKEAAKGNLAPLAKFVALSTPVAGGTIAIKNKISGRKEGLGGVAMDTAGALGGIPGEVAVQAARYGTKNPVGTAASAVAPLAGEVATITQDAMSALHGHPKPAERYVAKLTPVVGSRLANKLIPTSIGGQTYARTASDAEKSLSGDTKAAAALKDYLARSKDPTNGKTIQNSPGESIENALALSTNDKLRNAVQKFEKSQVDDKGKSNYAPSWNLSAAQLKIYEEYKSMYTGDAAKNFIFQQNPWIKDVEAKDQTFYSTLPPSKAEASSQTPPYPKFDSFTQGLLDQYDAATPDEKTALLQKYGSQLTDAWGQKGDWTNAMRRAEGAPELKGYPVADAQTQQIMDYYNSLPKGDGKNGGSPERSAWIRANPDLYGKMTDYLAQASLSSLVKNASLDQFKGAIANQTLLRDIKNVGKYDIAETKNANGTTSYAINPQAAYAQSSAGSSFSPNPSSSSASKAIANYKKEAQARDAEHSVKALKYALPKIHVRNTRNKVLIKGAPKAPQYKVHQAGVGGHHVPKIKARATSNKARLRVK